MHLLFRKYCAGLSQLRFACCGPRREALEGWILQWLRHDSTELGWGFNRSETAKHDSVHSCSTRPKIVSLAGGLEHLFIVFPYSGKNHPNWPRFCRGVGSTTNQFSILPSLQEEEPEVVKIQRRRPLIGWLPPHWPVAGTVRHLAIGIGIL